MSRSHPDIIDTSEMPIMPHNEENDEIDEIDEIEIETTRSKKKTCDCDNTELKYIPEPLLPPITSDSQQDNWIVTRWRPFMAWTYMATCIFDFIIGPIFYNILQFHLHNGNIEMWQAITLQGGGLYHVAMGAVLGISALGRTKEKLAETTKTP